MQFKFDLQGLLSLALILLAGAGAFYAVRGDVALVQKDIAYIQIQQKDNKDELTREIKSVEHRLNEISKTVVK